MRLATNGNMTLIDTPGFNDPDKRRSDRQIFIDLVNTIRGTLKSPDQGISMFIQCILPDESERIRQSAVMTMLDVFLILSVFNSETKTEDIQRDHPKIGVVFNHVSKAEDPAGAKSRI